MPPCPSKVPVVSKENTNMCLPLPVTPLKVLSTVLHIPTGILHQIYNLYSGATYFKHSTVRYRYWSTKAQMPIVNNRRQKPKPDNKNSSRVAYPYLYGPVSFELPGFGSVIRIWIYGSETCFKFHFSF